MRSISPSILIALAFASCVTASAGLAPGGPLIPQPSTAANDGILKGNPFKHPGISDVLPKIAGYLPLHALATIDQTDTAWNALTRADIRTKTALQLAGSIHRAANGGPHRSIREARKVGMQLADDFIQIRDQLRSAHAGRNMQPVMLPSCFTIAPNHLATCLANLRFVTSYVPDLFAPDWILVSPNDIVHAILETAVVHATISPGHVKFAELQADQLLGKINMDGWSLHAHSLLIELRAHIQKTDKIGGLRVQEIISTVLCLHVTKEIRPHVDYDRKLVSGGVATLDAILTSILAYLSRQPAVISSNFLQNSMLYRDPSFQYDPLKSEHDCAHTQPSLYDIIRELRRVVTPHISSADRKLFGERMMQKLWFSWFIDGAGKASGIADVLGNIQHFLRAFAAINSALLDLHPSRDWLKEDESNHARMATEWLDWQVRRWSLEYFAVKDGASFALEVLRLLGENKAVPKWVDRNLLHSDLRNLAQAH